MIRVRYAVVLAIMLAVAGCGSKGTDVDSSLTAQRAQHRIYELMTDTLRGLPAGVGLSKTPDNSSLATFDKPYPIAMPCWGGDRQSEGPRHLRTSYWVVGVPAGATTEYFDRISRVWQDRGWAKSDSAQDWLAVKTEDGYGLEINNAGGDGALSMTGNSPCFPESAVKPIDPDPTEIKAQ